MSTRHADGHDYSTQTPHPTLGKLHPEELGLGYMYIFKWMTLDVHSCTGSATATGGTQFSRPRLLLHVCPAG